jgi:hypothetical protein
MRVESVEIYSDTTNAAVLRHPGRRFPGVLVQGDNLHGLCVALDEICSNLRLQIDAETYRRVDDVRNSMQSYLTHYKAVMQQHSLPLPFSE